MVELYQRIMERGGFDMARLVIALLFIASLSGCVVSQGTHKEALARIQNLEGERDGLISNVKELQAAIEKKDKELRSLSETVKDLETGKKDAEAKLTGVEKELEQKSKEILQLKKDVEDIRIAKDKEIEEIRFKIKEVQTRAEALLEKIKELQK